MTNADILMGVIALFGYVFIVCPCLISTIASHAKYLDAVKGGVVFTLFLLATASVIISLGVSVMYFLGDLRPGTPAEQLIEWVNSL